MSDQGLPMVDVPGWLWSWPGESWWHMAALGAVLVLAVVLRIAATVIRERVWWALVRPRRRPREREHPRGYR